MQCMLLELSRTIRYVISQWHVIEHVTLPVSRVPGSGEALEGECHRYRKAPRNNG